MTLVSLRMGVVVLLAAGLTACADSQSLSQAFKFRPDPVEPQPFVKAARVEQDKLDFIPVGFEELRHATPVKSAAQAKADIDALSAAGTGQGRASASAQAKAKPATNKPAKKRRKPLGDSDPAEN